MAAGTVMRKQGIMSDAGCKELGRIVYWVALPALLLVKISQNTQVEMPWAALGIMSLMIIISIIVILITARKQSPAIRGSLCTVSFRANAAFVGLPVALLLIRAGVCQPQLESTFLLIFGTLIPIFSIASVLGFLLPQHGFSMHSIWRIVKNLSYNPLLWSCGLGVSLAASGIGPQIADNIIMQTLSILGSASIPLALLMAGASLKLQSIRNNKMPLIASSTWKMILFPVFIHGLCIASEVDQETHMSLLIISASPCAVSSVPIAQELGGDEEISAAAVVLTTLMAPFSLVAFIMLASA